MRIFFSFFFEGVIVSETWKNMAGKLLVLAGGMYAAGLQGMISFCSEDNLVGSCSHLSMCLHSYILSASNVPTLALVQPYSKLIGEAGPGKY